METTNISISLIGLVELDPSHPSIIVHQYIKEEGEEEGMVSDDLNHSKERKIVQLKKKDHHIKRFTPANKSASRLISALRAAAR